MGIARSAENARGAGDIHEALVPASGTMVYVEQEAAAANDAGLDSWLALAESQRAR